MAISVQAKDIGQVIRKFDAETRRRLKTGIRRGAERGRGILARATPVDTGEMRARWATHTSGQGRNELGQFTSGAEEISRVYNDHPVVGIVEKGARPHPVSDVGILALERWVKRHPEIIARAADAALGALSNDQAARKIAMGIAWKLREKGQKPTYFVRDAVPRVRRAMISEVLRELRNLAKNPPKDAR